MPLLNVNADAAAPYAAANVIDRIEIYIRSGSLDTFPTELRLVDIRKIANQMLHVSCPFQQR